MSKITIEIAGRPFAVAPFKFAELRKAAPHIDRMNELMRFVEDQQKAGEQPGVALMADLMHELIELLAIGISKIDPDMTSEAIEEQIDLSFFASIRDAVFAILHASGFAAKGEAQAPSSEPAEGAAEALLSNSDGS
jgi:hypothetical protein